MRKVPEWIGKTDDSPIPDRVKDRVFEAYDRRCYLTFRPIARGDAWHVEHIKAICNGGENRESNLAPALVEPHKEKTRADRKLKSKSDRVRRKHHGIRRSKHPIMGWRRFDGTPVRNPKLAK